MAFHVIAFGRLRVIISTGRIEAVRLLVLDSFSERRVATCCGAGGWRAGMVCWVGGLQVLLGNQVPSTCHTRRQGKWAVWDGSSVCITSAAGQPCCIQLTEHSVQVNEVLRWQGAVCSEGWLSVGLVTALRTRITCWYE